MLNRQPHQHVAGMERESGLSEYLLTLKPLGARPFGRGYAKVSLYVPVLQQYDVENDLVNLDAHSCSIVWACMSSI